MDPSDPAYAGQKDYRPWLLAIYDPWVVGVVSRLVWGVTPETALGQYREHTGRRHLDVGPGTGYFIDKTAPVDLELTLLDPNQDVLGHCSEKLARLTPSLVEADVLKPLPFEGEFDSVALSHVLHCLPGPLDNKARAIRNVADVMSADGVLFGGTVLGLREAHGRLARVFLRVANKQGGFDNLTDSVEGLRAILSESFSRVEIDVAGSVAYFTATGRR